LSDKNNDVVIIEALPNRSLKERTSCKNISESLVTKKPKNGSKSATVQRAYHQKAGDDNASNVHLREVIHDIRQIQR